VASPAAPAWARNRNDPDGADRMTSSRTLPVPDGLDGMRVDSGLSRLLGLSRTVIAELAESGDVLLDGRAAGKSDRSPRAPGWR